MKTALLLWLLVSVAGVTRSQDHCMDGKARNIRITITSNRNETGQYLNQIRITRNDGETAMSGPSLKVNIEQGISECGDRKLRYIQCTYNDPTYSASDYRHYPFLGRYKFHNIPRTWFEAFHVCRNEGAHLAIINSDEEAHVLKEMFQSGPKVTGAQFDELAFLGFDDLYKEGTFVTILGTPLSDTGYSKFAPNEPNNYEGTATNPGQDCGTINKHSGLLQDSVCTWKLAFFCEQQL